MQLLLNPTVVDLTTAFFIFREVVAGGGAGHRLCCWPGGVSQVDQLMDDGNVRVGQVYQLMDDRNFGL